MSANASSPDPDRSPTDHDFRNASAPRSLTQHQPNSTTPKTMIDAQKEQTRKRNGEAGALVAEVPPRPAAPARNGKPETAPMDKIETATAVGLLNQLYREAQNGLRRVVAFGLYCYEVKDRIPHGKFGPWLKEHCPDISWRTVRCYMQLSSTVLENCGLQINDFLQIGSTLPFCRGGKLLLLEDDKVPAEVKPLREKICGLIDGKSARQLFLEFKTAEEDENGKVSVLPARGGGDRVWEAFIREKHPELIVDGRVPKRGKVDQSVRDELAAITAKRHAPTAEELAQDTRTALEAWLQVTRSILANEHLPTLLPQEFTAPMATLNLLKKRFEELQNRFRGRAGRKRKKAAPAPRQMPK